MSLEFLKQNSSTRENLGLLAVLEALEGHEETTQREIAQTTGLNLKKVNYMLQKLLEKGHIKFQRVRQNPDKRAYLYILTPSGIKAKSQLTYGFLKFTLGFYGKAEQKLRDCLQEMSEAGVTRIALFGASDIARILLDVNTLDDVQVIAVLDESPDAEQFNGVPLRSIEEIGQLNCEGVLITSVDGVELAEQRLQELGISDPRIWRLS